MDGIIIIDKPGGITSFQVVKRVKNILKAAKVGHGGTLDPLATGVLPIFLNRATKLASFLMNGTKKYRATMKLGVETDTQDCEGKITSESDRIPKDHEVITRALNSFQGTIEQVPPMFSALKFQGTPLYKLARKGISLDLKARKVHLHEITPIDITPPFVTFEVSCSPGTYIRTLCADAGKKLGCGAHLTELKRLQSGSFLLDDSISLDQLNLLAKQDSLNDILFSLSKTLKVLPEVTVENQVLTTLRKSGSVLLTQLKNTTLPSMEKGDFLTATCQSDSFVALVQSQIDNAQSSMISDTTRIWKLVCMLNPRKNTIH
jgi:tRNA pseudouridine55 synthase